MGATQKVRRQKTWRATQKVLRRAGVRSHPDAVGLYFGEIIFPDDPRYLELLKDFAFMAILPYGSIGPSASASSDRAPLPPRLGY